MNAVKLELEKLVKQYGIKDSKRDEKFIKAVQKAAATKGMTVAEYSREERKDDSAIHWQYA